MTNILKKYNTACELYRNKGFRTLINEIWRYFFINSLLAPYLKRILGTTTHQKLLAYPFLGYWPRIQNPRSINEKIFNRKLCTNNEAFALVADKWKVREYVEEKVGDKILSDIYYTTDTPVTIPFNELPAEFVIKPTHMSGSVLIVDDKNSIDEEHIIEKYQNLLSNKYGEMKEEYWYNEIKPRIIIEERLHDDEYRIPLDFKFFVFHGEVKYIQVDYNRFLDHKRRIFDRNWDPQEFSLKYPLGPDIEEPEKLEEMIDIAETLGSDFDFIRVDLYQLNNERIVFGELTVAPGSGIEPFVPQKYDFKLGSLW